MIEIMIPYCTLENVKNLSRVNPTKLGLEKADTEKLDNILNNWIIEASALINDYTKNPLTQSEIEAESTKYYVYRNVATRIVSNIIALSSAYKSHSVVKVNDWTIKTVPSEVFPTAMKDELTSYLSETNGSSLGFGVLTVKGGGIFNEDRNRIS